MTDLDTHYVVRLDASDGQSWTVMRDDACHALSVLRVMLEPAGIQPCCQGARLNARVSGMSGSMSGKRLAYLPVHVDVDDVPSRGRAGRRRDVRIRPPAPPRLHDRQIHRRCLEAVSDPRTLRAGHARKHRHAGARQMPGSLKG